MDNVHDVSANEWSDQVQALQRQLHIEQTARQHAERRVAEFEAMVQGMPKAFYLCTDGTMICANEAARRMLGLLVSGPLDQGCADLMEQVNPRDAETGEPLTTGDTSSAWVREHAATPMRILLHHAETGEEHMVRVWTAPVVVNGDPIGTVTCGIDMTDEYRTETHRSILSHITEHINTPLDVATRLKHLLQIVVPALADLCLIQTLTERNHLGMTVLTHRDPAREAHLLPQIAREHQSPANLEAVVRAIQTGRTLHYERLSATNQPNLAHEAAYLTIAPPWPITSLISVPLQARGRPIGMLTCITDQSRRHYGALDVAFLSDIAWRVGLALDTASILEQTQESCALAEEMAERIGRLQQITAALAGKLTVEAVIDIMVTQVIAATQAQAGAFLQLNGQEIDVVLAQGYPDEHIARWQRFSLDTPMPAAVGIRDHLPIWLESGDLAHARFPQLTSMPSNHQAWAILPLHAGEHAIGALVLSFAEQRSFSNEDRAFMLALAQQCSQAFERSSLYEAEQHARTVAEDAVRQRDQMFSLVSHDLKTPLATIQSYIYLLQQRLKKSDKLDLERLAQGLDNIGTATKRIASQVEELLDIASLQAGQPIKMNREPYDLGRLVQRAVNTYQQMSNWHRIILDVPDSPMIVPIDVLRLERVLGNLLSNAMKYSPDGGDVHITITRTRADTSEWIVLSVQDEGIGIPPDELPTIFNAFQRGSNIEHYVAGSGLGLASTRQIVEHHGGRIYAESQPDKGSTFTIWLPVGHTEV
ncbi:MAG: GAF domain-containing protein [Chloroflexaceae bacterium]|nr:GAF domain-containing protein [Chloroflexaceae bacterium]